MRFAGLIATVLFGLGMSCSVALSSGASASSSTASNSPRGGSQQPAQQTSINIQQPQAPPQSGYIQNNPNPKTQSSIQRFAVKNHSKIEADNKKGGGEYLTSLVTLMESEGIPKAEALVFIKQALRKANGNAETFGEQIEKFVE